MRSRRRRRQNKGLAMLLGGIVAVFAILLVVVGIKAAIGGLSSGKKAKEEKKKEEAVLVTGIELSSDRAVVRAGEPIALHVNVTPENATDKSLEWTMAEGMGSVDANGVYTPSVEAGKSNVELTATAKDGSGITATIKIRVLEAIDPSKPMVAITYDDGPSDETTPKLLDVLEEKFAVATFFMLGNRISGNEAILQRSYAMGNELANHSYDHPQLTSLGSEGVAKQLGDTDELIKSACPGVERIIMRPPYGAFNDSVKSAAKRPIIMWSVDTLDWKTRNADSNYQACMEAKDGDIILMHDIHEATVAAAERIVTGLQEKGFQLVTVSELYEYRKGTYGEGTVHYSMTLEEYNEILAQEAVASAPNGTETDSTAEEGNTSETDATVEEGNTDDESDAGEEGSTVSE